MSSVLRGVKNVTKGYSNTQVKVRNATSNANWGPTGIEMSEIAQLTFNGSNDFYEIMDMLDKRLNDKGKNWRHVLKSLKVLDYCLHEGSELVVTWARKNIYIIKTLREFQYIDEDGKDVGQNVRVSAKELTSLIIDEERLRAERSDRKNWKSRVTGIEEYGPQGGGFNNTGFGNGTEPPPRRQQARRPQRPDENDIEYNLAIEASKHEAEEDERRRAAKATSVTDDDDLAKAIKLSKEEEELRRRELEESNANSLFDTTPTPSTQPQPTGFNQGYQQQGAVDWYGNPVDQQPQQQQNTGFLNNAYSQNTGFQPQQTGFQPQQTGFQPQQTGFDQSPFQAQPQQQQQQQQQSQQPNYFPQTTPLQTQQTAFNNPYAQQSDFGNAFGQQQQQVSSPQAGSHNPWASSSQNQLDSLKPTPTGSNNPFATQRPQPQKQFTSPPTLSSLSEQRATTSFNNTSSFNPITNFQSPQQQQPKKEENPHHARLNALLATGEGLDTFGNTGESRIPSQHTAPGNFVNSAGHGLNKIHATQTGNNPFFSQQFTGGPGQQTHFQPQSTGSPFGSPPPGQQPVNRFGPAQTSNTGFASSPFGQPSNNPFGQQGHQAQQQPGSLIDL